MDLAWLSRNVVWSWKRSASLTDAIKMLYWTYSHRFPRFVRLGNLKIRFRYPLPLGRLELSVRTNSSDRFIFGEVFDHNYYRLEGFVPRTILDLGANVGFTAVYYSKWFPSAAIACVEPEPGNLKVLYHNMAMNGVRAKIFEAAISKSDGEETLSLSDQDYGHKIVDVETGDLPRSIRVKAIAVQTLLRELKWLKIDLLKIDIEGYETKLFQSGCNWLHQVDKMFIEWHETVQQAEVKLSELARQYGFLPPKLLPGIWLLEREADVHTAVLDGTSE